MPTYAPNLKTVPCRTGTGAAVDVVDAALWGRHRVPQPLNVSGVGGSFSGDVIFPDSFIGHYYRVDESGIAPTMISISAGALPPGLDLVQVSPSEWAIQGTPTTAGTYDWTLKGVNVASGIEGFVTEHMVIREDPDEGVGAVGGG